MAHSPSPSSSSRLRSSPSYPASMLGSVGLYTRACACLDSMGSLRMRTCTWVAIWMGARRRRKRKSTPQRRRTNIFTRESNSASIPSTQWTAKEQSPSRGRLALHADLAPSWPSIGTDITAASATPLSRWMLKPSRRTKKSWRKRRQPSRQRRRPRRKKLQTRPQQARARRTPRKELPRRNDHIV